MDAFDPNSIAFESIAPLRTGSLIPITVFIGNVGSGNPILKIQGTDVGQNFPVFFTEDSSPFTGSVRSVVVDGMPLLLRPGQDIVMLRLDFPTKQSVVYVELSMEPGASIAFVALTDQGYEKFTLS